MELSGTQEIRRDLAGVWTSLNDPAVLQQCIPGCESLQPDGENGYRVVVMAAVGPVKARFNGKLSLSDIVPQQGYSLLFEGSGGAAGFAKGGATVSLAPGDGGTLLSYKAQAKVGGKLAQVGSRLIDGVAARMSAEFFARFKEAVELANPVPQASATAAAGAPAPAAAASALPAAAAVAPARPSRYAAMVLAVAGVLAVAVIWYLARGQ
jgi:carbon monoxide dehydrogenase subunit G